MRNSSNEIGIFQQARFDYRRVIERRWICPKKKVPKKLACP
jgi:hypothetical protein